MKRHRDARNRRRGQRRGKPEGVEKRQDTQETVVGPEVQYLEELLRV
jgi:hypothetical protein